MDVEDVEGGFEGSDAAKVPGGVDDGGREFMFEGSAGSQFGE